MPERNDKPRGYLRTALALSPMALVKGVVDFPEGAIDQAVEKRVAGEKVTRRTLIEAMKGRGLGRAVAHVPWAISTAPLYFSGLKDLRNDDPRTRRRGYAKLALSGGILGGGKGGTEAAIEARKAGAKAFKRLVKGKFLGRMGTGVAGSLLLARGIVRGQKESEKSKGRGGSIVGKYLIPGLAGAGVGAGKGAVEAMLYGGLKHHGFRKGLLAPAAGRAAAGFVGGAVLGELVHRFKGLAEGRGHVKKADLEKFAEEADKAKDEEPQITIPGMKPGVRPYPHQKRAIEKMLHNGGVIVMAHGVGSGKCVRAGTPVLTNHGLVPIESLFPSTECRGEETLPAPADLRVISLTPNGALVETPVTALFRQRLPESETTVRLKTERGVEYDVTEVHPLPTFKDGVVEWKSAALWSVGDYVALPRRLDTPEVYSAPDDLVELLAWQLTEGSEYSNGKNMVRVTNNDEQVLQRVVALASSLGLHARIRRPHPDRRGRARSPYVEWCSVGYRRQLTALGYAWGNKPAAKALPAQFVVAPLRQARNLLSTVFEAEGSVSTTGVDLTTASRVFANQLVYLLLRFGIQASVHTKTAKATNGRRVKRTYYRLYLSGEALWTFAREVGFLSERKQGQLVKAAAQATAARTKFGTPVQDVALALQAMGLGCALRGTSKALSLMGDVSLSKVASALLTGPRLRSDYCGEVAGRWHERTAAAVTEHSAEMLLYAQRLAWLASGPIGFDRVVSVTRGEAGGVVYDLHLPEHHNFVAGLGCGLVHNTETSIMGHLTLKALGRSNSAIVIVPASLRRNYADRVKARTTATVEVIGPKGEKDSTYVDDVKPGKDFYVVGYELFRQHPELVERLRPGTLILDEYHKVRNPAGSTYEAIMAVRSAVPNFIGMTGSIVNNDPADIAPLISMATNNRFMSQTAFKRMFERRIAREAGFFGGQKYVIGMQNIPQLQQQIGSLVDYVSSEDAAGDKMPRRKIETIEVPMSREQEEYYRYVLNKLNPVTTWQIRNNIAPSDREMNTVFQQLLKARQVSNSLHTIDRRITPAQASYLTPKVNKLLEDTQEHLKTTPDGQVVIYSNMVHGGADVIAAGLKARGIPFGVFLGKDREVEGVRSSDQARTQAVQDFLSGKTRVIVLSGAGAEGLNLTNTTMVQSLDGHFNPERILQAEARGRRIGGLAHRPPEQRQVVMKRYVSTIERDIWDKLFGKKETSVDQWIYGVAGRKAQINRQMLTALTGIPEKKTQPLEAVLSTTGTRPAPTVVHRPNPGIELPRKFNAKYLQRFRKPSGEIVYRYDNQQVRP